MHDCNPPSEVVAMPAKSLKEAKTKAQQKKLVWENDWRGDVWKCIIQLRSSRVDINTFVLNCDLGLGIITKRNPPLNYSAQDIEQMNYHDLEINREKFLSQKDAGYFQDFLTKRKTSQ